MKLKANGIELNVWNLDGAAPALVFLHYWGGSSRTWGETISLLGLPNRIVALDLRGWGDSDKPPHGYGIGELADDVSAAIAALNLTRYVLIGHSMGGKIAQVYASRTPIGCVGLILVAPSPACGVRIPEQQRLGMLSAYESGASVEGTLDQVLTAQPLTGELRRRTIEDSLRGSPGAKHAWPAASLAEDVSHDLARITVPTLVIGAELDRVDPVAMLEVEVVAKIAGSVLHVIAGSGHLLPLEAPAQLAACIAEFVAELVQL